MEKKPLDEITHKIKKINTKLKEVRIDIDNALSELREEHEKISIELEDVYNQLEILNQEIDDINNADRIEKEKTANKLINEINELTNPNYEKNTVIVAKEETPETTEDFTDIKTTKADKQPPKFQAIEEIEEDVHEEIEEELHEEIEEEIHEDVNDTADDFDEVEEAPVKKKRSLKQLLIDTFTTEVDEPTSFEKFEKEDVDTINTFDTFDEALDNEPDEIDTQKPQEIPQEVKATKKSKKKNSKLFSIFIVVLIASLTSMSYYGWNLAGEFFDAYEQSVPEVILDEIVLDLNNGEYIELLKMASFDVNQFENQNSVVQNIKLDQKANYEYVKDTSTNYYLIRDSIKIGEVSLATVASNNKFELPTYELETVVFDLTPINAVILTVPHNSTITINGITPSEDDCSVDTIEIANFSDKFTAYQDVITVTGLMTQPEIKVFYNEVELLEENGVYSIRLDEQQEEYIGNLALEIAKKYANFTSNDLTLEDISHYFDTTTDTYNKVKTYDGKYYNSHYSFAFSDVIIGEVQLLNDDIIEANVSFNYTITSWSGDFEYPSSYTIYFDRSNNKVISLGMN